MNFIKAFFKTKLSAIKAALRVADSIREMEAYWAYVLIILCIVLCTVVGILLLPFDLIGCAIVWGAYREEFQAYVDDVVQEWNQF
jgi:hypothetical protein